MSTPAPDSGHDRPTATTCNKCRTVYSNEFDRCPTCGAGPGDTDYTAKPVAAADEKVFDATIGGCLLALLPIGLCAMIGWLLAGSTGAWIGGVAGFLLIGSCGGGG